MECFPTPQFLRRFLGVHRKHGSNQIPRGRLCAEVSVHAAGSVSGQEPHQGQILILASLIHQLKSVPKSDVPESALFASWSPKTCGWRRMSFSVSVLMTSLMSNSPSSLAAVCACSMTLARRSPISSRSALINVVSSTIRKKVIVALNKVGEQLRRQSLQ